MEPHADAHGRFRRPSVCAERALRGDRAAHGVAGAHEREEECVALGVDLATTGAAELLAQDPAVLVQHIAVRIAEIATQLRRSFDVGEQERDRPRRQLTRGALDRTIVIADAAWFRALRTRRPSSGAAVVPAGGAASSPFAVGRWAAGRADSRSSTPWTTRPRSTAPASSRRPRIRTRRTRCSGRRSGRRTKRDGCGPE